ncbi:organic cation/carnitine transporter 6-like [Orbicella faveolata]|uniref:organic cation/carnitine transporter 6-like n=1 Tax=Orbicella faveolata TaxID=48498 RepID=UPI0009E1E856|nr:organic cation/carnitine transporter 6-like [Orbicella faveolata]
MALDVDSTLRRLTQLGPYQIRILVMFMFIFLPIAYQTLIMVFAAYEPPWMCANNSSACLESNSSSALSKVYSTATRPIELYDRRCSLNRSDWKFADYNLYEGPHKTIVDQVIKDKVISCHSQADSSLQSAIFKKQKGLGVACDLTEVSYRTGWPEKRALAGTVVWFYFTATLMILGLIAYFVRNWRTLMILSSAPWIFTLAFWKICAIVARERTQRRSPRNLDERSKGQQQRHAKRRTSSPRDHSQKGFLGSLENMETGQTVNHSVVCMWLKKVSGHSPPQKGFHLTYLLLLYFRFVHGVLYYGFSLSSGEFGGIIYLNFALTSLVEVPSHVLAIDNCNRFGRKKTTVVFMTIVGLSIVAVSFIPAGTENTGNKETISVFISHFCTF